MQGTIDSQHAEICALNRNIDKLLKENRELRKRLKKYENAADEGIMAYAEKIDFLYNSNEYLRYEIFKEFEPDIKAIREEINEEVDFKIKKELETELYATMRELINALHNPNEYLKSLEVSK